MAIPDHSLDALEQQRLTLEDNVLQLQKSLYHWRTWEAEYDSLRDEIRNLDDDATTDDFLSLGRDHGGELLTKKEMQTIVANQGAPRSRNQIVDLLGRRIDYVKQNMEILEKRLKTAEAELYKMNAQDGFPVEGAADFPMREIFEELDEEGNIVSSSVNAPGNYASDLLETLKKAGVSDIPDKTGTAQNATDTDSAGPEKADANHEEPSSTSNISHPQKKNGTAQDDDVDLSQPVSLVTLEDRKQPPVTDVNESLEEARLRREMLQYGIDEVGAIVAELELDEDGSDVSVDDDDNYDLGTDDEDEDEFGRSRIVLSEEYHQQMRDLETKLKARGMWNMGKDAQAFPEEVQEEMKTPPVEENGPAENAASDSAKAKKPKKRVAFADDLDIAPSEEPVSEKLPEKRTLPPKPDVPVLSDAVIERTDRTPETSTAVNPSKKPSRFKTARSAGEPVRDLASEPTPPKPSKFAQARSLGKEPNIGVPGKPLDLFPARSEEPKPFSAPIIDDVHSSAPRPPQGRTLAEKLVEREVKPQAVAAPVPDDLNDETHRREIASEFYKARNRMIQSNGGFVDNDEATIEPIEAEDPRERVSKFKAARMR
ncbi:hypothetical protein N7492_005595 [Penicillium capsulatum]|uniref:DUF3835 domain-containing protein n=1 Tax=Penicillium capsulatum TaxID=69766 RepID=A0A9W9IDP9_9EURO|nr:hypothetical protein N7492_005595 [Penicillium capsulatum]KAJ6135306.1 hypothetical protein N7512_000466 [Penicillium capsulatum]